MLCLGSPSLGRGGGLKVTAAAPCPTVEPSSIRLAHTVSSLNIRVDRNSTIHSHSHQSGKTTQLEQIRQDEVPAAASVALISSSKLR